ncbi:hypothetical protein BB559_007145 [Furculomyces boomerangus]|uniref:2-isopropylmalate synthase n=2 Tax=Harpellales TaxID=61421 RepID=A0A2T9XYP7_9FUNG|nr:hypothetical protein BB559_007145 [Furculomyces boomerangus]PWA02632.1 hypothetical protein BB558_001231 [Smittium angustum]
MIQKNKLVIFDTTLRDGEQSPGVTLNIEEKVAIAKQLSKLGVDVIEAGFPVASPGDFLAVQKIAQEVGSLMEGREKIGKPITVCGLARAIQKDIQTAYDAIKSAQNHRIHTFLATSDIHLEHKLKISREQCLQRAIESVTFAKSLCSDIEFSPEDAARSDPEFLVKILAAVIEAGATTLNIPDTVGYKTPLEYGELISYLIKNTPGSDKVIWSTHCHDDLGLATANTLAGISSGACQVEVTMNGIGERAGNTALEEVVMNIHTHPNTYPVYHTINTRLFASTSRLVSDLSGMIVQPNKAIVGRNAFLHESGIHQDGVLKNKETYEIIRPEDVGVFTSNLLLGKHSGRHAIKQRLEDLGYTDSAISESQLNDIFSRFKHIADSKKTSVTDDDLRAIASETMAKYYTSKGQISNTTADLKINGVVDSTIQEPNTKPVPSQSQKTENQFYELTHIQVVTGTGSVSTATVTLKDLSTGKSITDAALAYSGPVEALLNAIKRVLNLDTSLKEFNLSATSVGSDSIGKATIKIQEKPAPGDVSTNPNDYPVFTGIGADTDILAATAHAYVAAVNRLLYQKSETSAQRSLLKDRSAPV